MENKFKSRDVFYGIIAIATLIVAIIGATLAYFSITANSAEGAVNAGAATVSVNYQDGQQVSAAADELIPATFDIVKKAYAKNIVNPDDSTAICLDDNSKQVCSIYRFSISSDLEREVVAKLNNEHNEFTYLSYAVYDVTANAWIELGEAEYADIDKCDNTNTFTEGDNAGELDPSDDCYTITTEKVYTNDTPGATGLTAVNPLFGIKNVESTLKYGTVSIGSTAKTYDVVLFIRENDANQNVDQGATYNGTIFVEVTGGATSGHITGHMND